MINQSTNPPSQSDEVSLRTFTFLWALLGLFTVYPGLIFQPGDIPHYLKVLSTFAGCWLLLRPSSLFRLFFFVSTIIAVDSLQLPVINNHGMTIFVVNIAIVIFFLVPRFSGFEWPFKKKQEFYQKLIPAIRLTVIVVYFWALLHKLNSGYFSKDISCAAVQLYNLQSKTVLGVNMTFIPTGDWIKYMSIYGTLVLETTIPTLLLFRRTQIYGVFLGYLFHLVLGIGYPAFSVMMYVFLTLFLPPHFWKSLILWWRSSSILRRWAVKALEPKKWDHGRKILEYGAILIAVVCLFYPPTQMIPDEWAANFRYNFCLIFEIIMISIGLSVLLFARRNGRPNAEDSPGVVYWTRSLAFLLPFALFLNGWSPHLGLKSTLSYAMFSNLRAEDGASNHFIFPVSMQIWNVEKDLVTIISCDDPALNDLRFPAWHGARSNRTFTTFLLRSPEMNENWLRPTWKLPYIALRQRISFLAANGHRNISLVYERNGRVYNLKNAEADPELSTVPFLARKFFRSRAVPSYKEGCCMW